MSQTAPKSGEESADWPAPSRAEPARHSIPILYYLAFLIAVIVLPATAFTGVLLSRHNIAQEETVQTFTVATARSVLQAVEREISGMITTQRVLVRTAELDGDAGALHAHASTALAGTGADFIMADAELNLLFNTAAPYGTPLGQVIDRDAARRAFETPDAVVTDVFRVPDTQNFHFSVMRRVTDPAPLRLAILTQEAGTLANAVLTRELPTGWYVALVDSDNRVLIASDAGVPVGEELFIPLYESPGTTLRWQQRHVAGDDYKIITQSSILTGWHVVAWAPTSVVEGPLRSALFWLLLGALAIVGLAALAAAIIAQRIAASVRGLARQARAIGAGRDIAPVAYPVRELAVVSEALAEAAASRKDAETEARFLLREVAHRSKNQLTVISAMANQTARGAESVEKFVESFQHRLFGLARSTDLLLAHGTQGIGLRDLIGTQIDPFRPEDPSRVTKTGPAVYLNVQAAQVLGMAAHELATNAAKYGAFSREGGKLTVEWNRAGGRLHLVWRETVPGFAPPSERKGFGTVVLRTMVAGALKAEVERIVHEDGIEWVFSIPFAEIDPDRDATGPRGEDPDAD